ncbi:MAG: class I SAM-dependent methyltransferase [Alphaproteobacteria bacterium]|nr:class I SAM-dependent methyltransferase [Alphaproteobacteria bacterium]
MTECLVCGESSVEEFLDLNSTALANKFLRPEDTGNVERAYPLRVGFCHDCNHVQLMERVAPEAMFDDYLYISSMSDTLVQHLRGLAATVCARFALGADDLVIDIGCNDGTLLKSFQAGGVKTLGVEPAANLAAMSRDAGINVVNAYFGTETAQSLRADHGAARVIALTNVFPHLPFLDDFMNGVQALLAEDGVLVLEAHYLQDLLAHRAFDTVYHEHASYWSLRPMMRLFARFGMEVIDVERLPIHHGQIRVFAQRIGVSTPAPRVAALAADEIAAGLNRLETFVAFADSVRGLKRDLWHLLNSLAEDGQRIAAYGAPAKGSTLLSFFEIGPDTLPYIADKSPLKQGRVTPGTHIPVVSPAHILEDKPDYMLLLAWNFADEIMAQQAEFRAGGGRFIIPVPEVRVV